MNETAPPTDVPPGPDPQQQGPRVSAEEMRDLGRLRRSVTDRRIAGVAGGLARHLDVDPVIVRVLLVVLVFFGGAGLLAYAAVWLLVPEEGSTDEPLGLDERSRGLALVGAGVLALLAAVGDWAGAFWFPWPVVVLALVVLLVLERSRRSRGTSTHGPAHPAGPAPYAAAAPYAAPASYVPGPPSSGPPTQYLRPRNPRKRGPVLFWLTLALAATGIGILGMVDVSGVAVADSAYPALALGVTGAMLVVGAFWGRAGGLVLVGLVAALATLVSTAGENWEDDVVTHRPLAAAEVSDHYEIGAGELTLDLRAITDVEALDGRELELDGGVGRIEVLVPRGVDVSVDARVGGPGELTVFGRTVGGINSQSTGHLDGGTDVSDLSIDVSLGVGQVVVRER